MMILLRPAQRDYEGRVFDLLEFFRRQFSLVSGGEQGRQGRNPCRVGRDFLGGIFVFRDFSFVD
jgi:hypothetical protein